MAQPKLKIALIAIAILFAILVAWNVSTPRGRTKLPVGSGTPMIALGQTHGIILASDGSLWSWGSDFLGWPVLGLGKVHAQARLQRIGRDTNWVSISVSDDSNLAIKSDGSLWAWGQNIYGQFGTGPAGKTNAMSNVPVHAAAGNDWKQATAGGCFSLALKTNGTLWAWGNNWAGPLGIGTTSNSFVPVQVGDTTNWTKVRAGRLETVALQSDGSLWYWGQTPDSTRQQNTNQILVPTRVSLDTDWADVGTGEGMVFAIKSNGTLWAWGRNANLYTSQSNVSSNFVPVRVGTNSDWQSISSSGWWWCQGIIKKDGSLWFMDASDGKPNGPTIPFNPVQFRPATFTNNVAVYVAGAAHAPAPGHHEPIGVVLTRDGEVWTWGMILGEKHALHDVAENICAKLGLKVQLPDPKPTVKEKPWPLMNVDSGDGK